jgi:uncharacterized protein (DUF433 family)
MPALAFEPLSVPLYQDEDGVIRVGETRIILEAILGEHSAGENVQAIADNFPPLAPADIYAVLAYYYRHRATLDEYLRERRGEAERLRREIETAQGDDAQFWAETRNRWAERKKHAESGH